MIENLYAKPTRINIHVDIWCLAILRTYNTAGRRTLGWGLLDESTVTIVPTGSAGAAAQGQADDFFERSILL